MKVCDGCGVAFEPNSNAQRYHSRDCQRITRNRREHQARLARERVARARPVRAEEVRDEMLSNLALLRRSS